MRRTEGEKERERDLRLRDSISIICRFVDSELCDYAPPLPPSPLDCFTPRIGSPLLSTPPPLPSSSRAVPPQRRHRLRRPPLNQVSDYLLEIDFTCSARFCICTRAPVRRTSAIVRATSWKRLALWGLSSVLILRLRLSFSWFLVLGFIVAPLTAPIFAAVFQTA